MKEDALFDSDYEETIELSSEEIFSKVSSYTISYNISTLLDLIVRKELELEPEFQRNFVWDIQKASLFIDSLLIGFPTPNLFFGRNSSKEDLVVIDGLQRLKTIYFFVGGHFLNNSNFNNFRLTGLQTRSWNGMSFSELPKILQRRLLNSLINATVVDDIDFNPRIVHELFYRINTTGVPLTNQEIRNCVYSGPFNRVLHELNNHNSWRTLLGNPIPHLRLADIESLLRIIAFIDKLDNYHPPMREFISYYQSINVQNKRDDLALLFTKTCDTALDILQENAFRPKKVINRTYLETILTAIGIIIKENNSLNKLADGYIKFVEFMNEHKNYFINRSSSERVVKERIMLAIKFIEGKNV